MSTEEELQREQPEPDPGPDQKAGKNPEQHGAPLFPIVGIGASAGGLHAFEEFFSGMPQDKDTGMAFVLVQHLAPDHNSMLTELIQRKTRMKVVEVMDGIEVEPNCAYVIPPNHDMAFLNGQLHLMEPGAPRGHRLPIDYFFRSLAQDQHERAVCIVLSGTGSDGSIGVRAIKGEGGMVIAQDPETAEFDGMPQNAIQTGVVDFILPPKDMASQLIAYAERASSGAHRITIPTSAHENGLKKIFVLLRAQTGHDFSLYKRNTIIRRVERRMAVHQMEGLEEYTRLLRESPSEAEALFRDLLIGVTSFFRDLEAFEALAEKAVPKIIAGKSPGGWIRVWIPGCSTGEEAYSVAILFQEKIEALRQNSRLQIFATDLDRKAIAHARTGAYPACIAADISPERLRRFFSRKPDDDTYHVSNSIRERIVFSEQSVVRDPPFSKVDLICCRNLLIYMNSELQKKIIPLFHYALNPNGFLFLGTSETIGDFGDLFSVTDRKQKLFQRKEDGHSPYRQNAANFMSSAQHEARSGSRPAMSAGKQRATPKEVLERTLLGECSPAAALVTSRGDILYLHGRTGLFLEPAPGEPTMNILRMAREGLRQDLTTAIHHAASANTQVRHLGIRVKTNGHFANVNLTVRPIKQELTSADDQSLYLILMEEIPEDEIKRNPSNGTDKGSGQDADGHVAELVEELAAKEEYLLAFREELEISNEELKSSGEEMQSMNEELQATNEELETSKEELQSMNEELSTVNAELQNKVVDLSRLNNDMNNFLAGTELGIIFVDHQLRIQRFTPKVTQLVNLIAGDVGRPLEHFVSNLGGYDNLIKDLRKVLDTLQPHEVEVQDKDGHWFLLSMRPYRTLNNVIEGAVISFTENTKIKLAQMAIKEAEALRALGAIVSDARDAILMHDLHGKILTWNPSAERFYGWSEVEALAMNLRDIIPEGLRAEEITKVEQSSKAPHLEPVKAHRLTKKGKSLEVWLTATSLLNPEGNAYAIVTTERPVK